jgi:hypothetical protein
MVVALKRIRVFGLIRAVVIPACVVLSAVAAAPAQAAGVSQITLSCSSPPPQSLDGNGCVPSNPIFSPVTGTLDFIGGFWIWCQNPSQGTPYGPDCSGSMYIEEITLPNGPGVYQTTPISGHSLAGTPWKVWFTTSDGDMTCTLDVPNPTSNGATSVSGTCDGKSVTFSGVVVNVT